MENDEKLSLPDGQILRDIINSKMPFGKYKDRILKDLPVSYLEWFARKGFPKSKLGIRLQTLYEIKINGLEYLLEKLQEEDRGKN